MDERTKHRPGHRRLTKRGTEQVCLCTLWHINVWETKGREYVIISREEESSMDDLLVSEDKETDGLVIQTSTHIGKMGRIANSNVSLIGLCSCPALVAHIVDKFWPNDWRIYRENEIRFDLDLMSRNIAFLTSKEDAGFTGSYAHTEWRNAVAKQERYVAELKRNGIDVSYRFGENGGMVTDLHFPGDSDLDEMRKD